MCKLYYKYYSFNKYLIPAQLLANLAHMKEGLTDAIVTMGTIDHLFAHLNSEDEEVDPIHSFCANLFDDLSDITNGHT